MQNLELLWQIRAELLQKGFQRRHSIHVHPSNGADTAALEAAATKLQASVAPTAGEQRHVMHDTR